MHIEEIRSYALSKPGAEEGFPFGEETLVFKAGGRIFLMASLDSQPLTINAKCDPVRAVALREQYACIVPGYHMNKRHWNSITIDHTLSDNQLKELIDHSYGLVISNGKKTKTMIENAPFQSFNF